MKNQHKYLSVVTAVAAATVLTMALRGQSTRPLPPSQRQSQADDADWPVAAYGTADKRDEKQSAKDKAKSNHHNKSLFGVRAVVESAQEDLTIVLTEDWETELRPLPSSLSDLVVIGTVVDARAFVTTDLSGVYSEFSTRVDEVLKAGGSAQSTPGSLITAQRSGGRVRGPAASVSFRLRGQNMPRRGRQYVMFLRRLGEGEDYKILTGYELRGKKVFPLDSADKFAQYSAWERDEFLQALQGAMTQP